MTTEGRPCQQMVSAESPGSFPLPRPTGHMVRALEPTLASRSISWAGSSG